MHRSIDTDKDGMWVGGYTTEAGPWRARQWSPTFQKDACQKCGRNNHATDRCLARGTKELPICRHCQQLHRDWECPNITAMRRGWRESRERAATLDRKERRRQGIFKSAEEEAAVRRGGADENEWPAWERRVVGAAQGASPAAGPSNYQRNRPYGGAHTRPNE